jgi:hypothetical protein
MVGTKKSSLPVYVMLMVYSMDMIHGHGRIVLDLLLVSDITSKHVHNRSMGTGHTSNISLITRTI